MTPPPSPTTHPPPGVGSWVVRKGGRGGCIVVVHACVVWFFFAEAQASGNRRLVGSSGHQFRTGAQLYAPSCPYARSPVETWPNCDAMQGGGRWVWGWGEVWRPPYLLQPWSSDGSTQPLQTGGSAPTLTLAEQWGRGVHCDGTCSATACVRSF